MRHQDATVRLTYAILRIEFGTHCCVIEFIYMYYKRGMEPTMKHPFFDGIDLTA